MARLIQHSLVLIVLLLHGRVCLGGHCSCLNADEHPPNDDDESHKKCFSICPTCSEDYAFIYKFNVIESCVGRCGQKFDRKLQLPCQCNAACKTHKNCCGDYDAFCLIESCAGRCGQFNSNLKCQCNSVCKKKKDCCYDYDHASCSKAENLESDNRDPSDTKMCLHCRDIGHPSISPDNCDIQFKVSCEAKNIDSEEEDEAASQVCPLTGSFIQWDPLTSCINFDQLKENWTGIMRSREMLKTAPDKWKPLQCKIKDGKTSEDLMLVKSSSNNCSDLMLFYCKNGSEPQKSNTTIMEAQENNVTMSIEFDVNTRSLHNTSNMMTGVIVGTVSLIIAIGVVIVVVVVCRRRRSAGRKPVYKQDAHRQNETEKIGHLENKNDYAYSEIEMEATNKKVYMDNGDNEYTTGTSDVYDHLNENKNRKTKTENPHAIYDHAIGDNAEPDYDSTKHVVPTNPDYQEVRIRSEEESHREKL